MITQLTNLIKNKKILVLGFGKEGQSTHQLLSSIGGYEALDVADANSKLPETFSITGHFGEDYLNYLNDYHIVFKTPGISIDQDSYTCQFTSQTQEFLGCYKKQCIGITGTKGKSTVSTLLYHVLKQCGKDTILCGNIGTPVFDVYKSIVQDTTIVMELSCHQLQYCKQSPSKSVFLNIFQDHLDHYGTFENYQNAKKNIFLHQESTDIIFHNPNLTFLPAEAKSKSVPLPLTTVDTDVISAMDKTNLKGDHNLYNIQVVLQLCQTLNLTKSEFLSAVESYQPLHHRLEYIGEKNKVAYYDDSISTTVESTICAINSVPNISTILIGGLDRGIEYEKLIHCLSTTKLDNVILMYPSGKRIYDMLKSENLLEKETNFILVDDLEQAVKSAQTLTKQGGSCVLSPAAASYGYFKNFEDRGLKYKALLNI